MNISNELYVKLAQLTRQISTESNLTVFVDDKHKILYVDAQLEKATGFSKDDLIGQDLNILLPRDVHSQHKNNIEKFRDDPTYARTMGMGRNVTLRGKKKKDDTQVEITLHNFPDLEPDITILAAVMIPILVTGDLSKVTEITERTTIDEDGKVRTFKQITEYASTNFRKVLMLLFIVSLGIGLFGFYRLPDLIDKYIEYLIEHDRKE